jgi:SAM-dependent methyltransferase
LAGHGSRNEPGRPAAAAEAPGEALEIGMSTLLYNQLARYYDLIYATKDYQSEAADQLRLIEKVRRSPGRELLEVACGTGRYLEHFEKRFRCTGLDLSPQMLRIARRRARKSRLVLGDMSTFDLGKQFDVVACLNGSIGYIHGARSLRKAVRRFAGHLKPGGVLVISPFVSRKGFLLGSPHLHTYEDADVKLARAVVGRLKGNHVALLRFHWLIAERNRPVVHVGDDVHELALHSQEAQLEAMRQAGLAARRARIPAPVRGSPWLYLGVKPL